MTIRYGIILIMVVLLFLGSSSCTKKTVYKDKEGSVTVEQKGESGKVTVKTEEGEAQIEAGKKLPENWPADMPVYKNAKIISSSSINAEQGAASLNVAVETSDGVEKVKSYYEKNLPAEGWTISQTATTARAGEEGAIITGTKDERTGIVTMRKKSGEKTEVVIQVFTNK